MEFAELLTMLCNHWSMRVAAVGAILALLGDFLLYQLGEGQAAENSSLEVDRETLAVIMFLLAALRIFFPLLSGTLLIYGSTITHATTLL